MKIKDLPQGIVLVGTLVKTPKGVIGLWKSQWTKGVWLTDGKSHNLWPQFIDNISDVLEWEVVQDEKEKINCHEKNSFKYIDNTN